MAAKNVTKQVSCHQLEQKTKLANELQINEKKVRINKLVLKGNLAEKRLTDKKYCELPKVYTVIGNTGWKCQKPFPLTLPFTIYNPLCSLGMYAIVFLKKNQSQTQVQFMFKISCIENTVFLPRLEEK